MFSRFVACAFAAAVFAAAAVGDAQNSSDAGERRCIGLTGIDRTAVVDDRTVLFYLKDGSVFENRLRATCAGLARNDRFSYRVSQGQICAADTINVLEEGGFGLIETAACALGPFLPTTEEDAATLLRSEHAAH